MEQHSIPPELRHWGVRGMRWGVRKDAKPASADAARSLTVRDNVKRDKIKTVSNADLAAAINRMQLEQNFKRLAVNEKSGVARWISSTLMEIGKREVQTVLAKKTAALVARKLATGGVA